VIFKKHRYYSHGMYSRELAAYERLSVLQGDDLTKRFNIPQLTAYGKDSIETDLQCCYYLVLDLIIESTPYEELDVNKQSVCHPDIFARLL